ncbi:MAG: agmatinase [Phycisphaerales bacterium]|nr:agmatinase [Phycisphaerales bacterium]
MTTKTDAGPMLPTFLGLEPEFCDPSTAAIAVLPVPYDGTSSWKKGADDGPRALLEASTQVEFFDIPTRTEPYRHGIATLPAVRHDGDPVALADLVDAQVDAALARHQLPVVLGGEHSVTIGAVRAAARRFPNLSVLQIDAHGDTRESYDGSTHNHACVMARVREWCPIVQVGIRAIDASEMAGMEPERTFFAHDICDGGDRAWMSRAIAGLTEDVYVTIDLDAFDPSLLPATGTPEPGGLGWYDVIELLRRVCAERRVVGFDVVELCPSPGQHASEFVAAKLVHRFMAMVLAER